MVCNAHCALDLSDLKWVKILNLIYNNLKNNLKFLLKKIKSIKINAKNKNFFLTKSFLNIETIRKFIYKKFK